jgi:hypothetical protein
MRRRRARTVWIMASVALTAGAVGIFSPVSRLLAQNPGDGPLPSAKPDPAPPPTALPADLPPTAEPVKVPALTNPGPLPPAKEPAAVAPIALADPEAAAVAFVERSQKEADEAIRALGKEAEALRARLQKVEAGLARWESVKEALADHGGPVEAGAGRPAWRSRASTRPPGVERAVGTETDTQPKILEPARPPESLPRTKSRLSDPPSKPDSSGAGRLSDPPSIKNGRASEALSAASETISPPIPPALAEVTTPPSTPATDIPK